MSAAAAGLVLGHMLTYCAVFPAAAQRSRVLSETGHAPWFDTVWFASQVAIMALVPVALRTLRERAKRPSAPVPTGAVFLWLMWRVAVGQTVGFAALEIAERVAASVPLLQPSTNRVVLSGLLIQLIIATIVSAALIVLSVLVERVANVLAAPPPFEVITGRPRWRQASWAPRGMMVGASGSRSPPLPIDL
jgi:hypothetical protein